MPNGEKLTRRFLLGSAALPLPLVEGWGEGAKLRAFRTNTFWGRGKIKNGVVRARTDVFASAARIELR